MSYRILVLGAVALQRLWELYHSHRLLAQARAEGGVEPQAEPAYALMVIVHAGWLAGMAAETWWWHAPLHMAVLLPALVVWGLALALRVWTVTALGEHWSVRLISRADQRVVTSGPFRYIRHPNYLAVILEVAAVPLVVGAYRTAVLATVANAVVLALRIRAEEQYLLEVAAYRDAFADKKRFIPHLF